MFDSLTSLVDSNLILTILTAIFSWSVLLISAFLDSVKPGLQVRKRDRLALFLIRKILNNFNPTTIGQSIAAKVNPKSVNAMRQDDSIPVDPEIDKQATLLSNKVSKRKHK